MNDLFRAFAADESGATAIEYGTLVMLVGVAVAVALEGIGVSLERTFAALRLVFAPAAPITGS